jgi:hypothetical protein
MNNPKRIGRSISQIMGQLIGLAVLLVVAVCAILLIPGMVVISWIDDLSRDQISTSMLWLLSVAISVGFYGLTRFLVKDSEMSWKLYGGICIGTLVLCIILSIGFGKHFGQHWTRRLMGAPAASKVLSSTSSANQ